MPIVLKKKHEVREEQLTVVSPSLSQFAAIIDSLGAMQPKVEKNLKKIKELTAEVKPYKDQLADLAHMITEHFKSKGIDPDKDDLKELGKLFQAELGKQGSSRSIKDTKKLFELMDDEVFFQLVKMNISDIDKYLTPPEIAQVLETERVDRSIKIVARPKSA